MDPYVSCPYNVTHRVPKSRIQAHIVKCEQKYPPLAICPYNATHRYPDDQIKAHVANCPAKEQFVLEQKPDKSNAILYTPQPIPNEIGEDDSDYECWD